MTVNVADKNVTGSRVSLLATSGHVISLWRMIYQTDWLAYHKIRIHLGKNMTYWVQSVEGGND